MDMTQYLDLFLEESLEHVQVLNQNLLHLEKNSERIDLLDEVFRSAHTLKGMAATMGFEGITHLTHEMENLLQKLKEHKIILNKEIIDSLFMGVDALENLVECIRSGEESTYSIDDLTAQFISLGQGVSVVRSVKTSPSVKGVSEKNTLLPEIEFNEFEKNLIKVSSDKNQVAWHLKISINNDCVMKSVRAFMVFRNIESLGEIIKSLPPVQDIEDEKFDKSFEIVLISAHTEEEIIGSINNISEVYVDSIEIVDLRQQEIGKSSDIQPGVNTSITAKIHQTVRVDISRLDKLMSLVGELVINKTRLEQIAVSTKLQGFNDTIEQINRITTDLQTVVQNVRMVSIEQVFNRFPRMVRDLAKELGKTVDLILGGKETELDRTVIDEIGDPLVHLIRNAIDHGLESPEERIKQHKNSAGSLRLSAKHEGNLVIITVEDDGKGINLESVKNKALKNGMYSGAQLEELDEQAILNLIFEPGFSTAQTVTDISGRGVGLDVVKSKIQSLNGQVNVETRLGEGTKFIIKLPLTLAIIQALLVKVQDETYAIPLGNIDETTILDRKEIKNIHGQQVMVLRGKVLPLIFLQDILDVMGNKENEEMYVVVVRKGEQQVGLVVDELTGQQEIVINTLGKLLSGLSGIAGASIMGDGKVSLILDIGTLF